LNFESAPYGPVEKVDSFLYYDINGTSIKLDGSDDYIYLSPLGIENLTETSISIWIKPQYGNGSAEYTIFARENSLILSVNNLLEPQQVAKLSFYDGIKWTSIESSSLIEEDWTHVVTTYHNSTLSLYLNGILESTVSLESVPFVNSKGEISFANIEGICNFFCIC